MHPQRGLDDRSRDVIQVSHTFALGGLRGSARAAQLTVRDAAASSIIIWLQADHYDATAWRIINPPTQNPEDPSMKTAISLPDALFEAAELLAGRLGVSRSRLYANALE